MIEIGKVINSTPGTIQLLLNSIEIFDQNKSKIKVSKYISIEDGNDLYILASIQNVCAVQSKEADTINYTVSCTPIGCYSETEDGISFRQGGVNLPSPTEPVYLPDDEVINAIFSSNDNFSFQIGNLSNNDSVNYFVDGNKFFGKHIAVVGSTGSGKSCAVARLLQNIMKINDGHNENADSLKNSHVIIFDIHSEYQSAFKLAAEENFSVNCLDVEKLCLPYWLMNSQELEALFIESNEMNSHNQISQFKKAVILSKEKHNPTMEHINYDTPVYFDIAEVYRYIKNKNSEVINKNETLPHLPKRSDGTIINNADNVYLNEDVTFAATTNAKDSKASNGPYNGEFERFVTRLETKLSDKRLEFITAPKKENGEEFKTEDFDVILQQFLGYIDKSNVTIIDLSAIPFEVLSIVISLLSRVIFDFAFHYSKLRHTSGLVNDIPFMLVCEEAHNYIPKNGGAEYNASKHSIERIAKEGRKYGLNLMVVSQRPSEVSETIFSQCNNFIVLKLTNVNDQNCIKNLLPDNNSSLVDTLPTLAAGECLVVGDAVPLPAVVKMSMPNPAPSSSNVNVYDEWNKDWINIAFEDVIKRWRKE
ncbi:ATP-binding protein [Ruminococcus sp.]|uniref:ATP-binding protein n=1 Tax=Ruminococcus sp. TaxID=41978 RepID=UPI003AF9F7EC